MLSAQRLSDYHFKTVIASAHALISIYQVSGATTAFHSFGGCFRLPGAWEKGMMMTLFSMNWAAGLIYKSQNYVCLVDLFTLFLKPCWHKIN